jgi:hypothetical protein
MIMLVKLGLGVVAAVLAIGTSSAIAQASDTHGGHCNYGRGSINVMPQCDTTSSHGTSAGSSTSRPTVEDLRPVLHPLQPTID